MPNTNRTTGQASFLSTEVDPVAYEKILAQNNFSGRSVGQILDAIAKIPDDKTVEKGSKFEELTQWALPLVKSVEIKSVRKPRGQDIGVDLIATHASGHEIAIQCKFYTTRPIAWGDISTFIGAARQEGVKEKWLICGGKGLSHNIITHKSGFDDVKIIDLRQYRDTVLTTKAQKFHAPLPLQQAAIDKVLDGFANAEVGEHGDKRGKLIMACGSGKTFTALRIAEQLIPATKTANPNILFIAPSISLVAQARNEWLNHTTRRLRTLVICSDQSAAHDEDIQPNEIAGQVTTSPPKAAKALKQEIPAGAARATFCTYQSLDKLHAAQAEHGAPKFDLAVIDEAHRTTGVFNKGDAGQFQLIHDAKKIKVAHRLYMTATPRIYAKNRARRRAEDDPKIEIVDMGDPLAYGNQFCHITFKQAVEAGMLCDYRVIALGVTETLISPKLTDNLLALNDEVSGGLSGKSKKGKAADAQSVLALGAISLAINGYLKGKDYPAVIERTIAFASNIRRSKWLQLALTDKDMQAKMKRWITTASRSHRPDADKKSTKAIGIQAKHLDGTDDAVKRTTELAWLRDGKPDTPRLISNAQLFTEGVDVPALNAIAFLDPRQSKIDTVQAVGRVMRRDPDNPDKTFGYIIVPVILPPGADLIATLKKDKSRFQSLGNVMEALRSHDERFDTDLHILLGEVNTASDKKGADTDTGDQVSAQEDQVDIQQSFLDNETTRAIFAQLAKNSGISNMGKNTADDITDAINRAAAILQNAGAAEIIATTIGTPTDKAKESCKTAALLIVNACIMHKRLDETGNLGDLADLESVSNAGGKFITELHTAWKTILAKDYHPIFSDAAALIKKLVPYKQMHPAMRILINCAIAKATTLNDLGFDHAGPLYHRVLGTAQSDGAFFTKNLSAYLLAGLAFDDSFADWKDMAAVKRLRVADPACGTGTLLMAALKAIKDKAAKAQNLKPEQSEALHKHLVENAIYGFDINKYSIQLAACNLTIGAPKTDYRGMNLYTLQHGPLATTAGDKPHLVRHGALEILLGKVDAELLQTQIADGEEDIYGTDAERKRKEFCAPDSLDAVIYNPPFTDTSLASGRYKPATKSAMRERLQQIKRHLEDDDKAAAAAIGKMSIRPYFTPLTHRLLSPSKGTLAKIIPATMCTAENGRAERQYIAANFQIEMVVTSHDPKHINFSENTSIHECLLVARRSVGDRQPTRFIQLATYPADVKAADELVTAIHSGEASAWFSETRWSPDKVKAGNWSPVQWMNPQLAHAADEMNSIPNTIESGQRYPWRPVGRVIREIFDYQPSDDGDMFFTIAEKLMQTMQAKPESKGTPKKGKQDQADRTWEQADHVLVPTRLSTTSSRLLAIYSEQPALGSAYCPIGVYDKNIAKGYVAFMNSSFGIIQMLNRRTKKLTYPSYEAGHMKTLRLPDPNADLSPLVDAFEKVKDTPLLRLAECHTDPARKILDHAAAEVIGIPTETTDQWRQWLAREPTITNKIMA